MVSRTFLKYENGPKNFWSIFIFQKSSGNLEENQPICPTSDCQHQSAISLIWFPELFWNIKMAQIFLWPVETFPNPHCLTPHFQKKCNQANNDVCDVKWKYFPGDERIQRIRIRNLLYKKRLFDAFRRIGTADGGREACDEPRLDSITQPSSSLQQQGCDRSSAAYSTDLCVYVYYYIDIPPHFAATSTLMPYVMYVSRKTF